MRVGQGDSKGMRVYARRVLSAVLAAAGMALAETPEYSGELRRFQALCAARAQTAQTTESVAIRGGDGWLYLAAELRHLSVGRFWGDAAVPVSRATNPEYADPLPAILDFHAQLAARGIKLLLVPVPPKAVIYPEYLPDDSAADAFALTGRVDLVLRDFYAQLRSQGVNVLDLTPAFLSHKNESDALYCRQDSHWSGRGCALAASLIAQEISAAFNDYPKRAFTGAWNVLEITGDLWRALPEESRPPREQIALRRVCLAGATESVAPDSESPLVLLGDSHCLVFHAGGDMHERGAGLGDQLALELGLPVDLAAVRGSGATPARINLLRRARKNPQYWSGKRWVVWCFAAREFTESDAWRKVALE